VPGSGVETLGAFLDHAAALAPQREAIAYAPHGRVTLRQTWAELREASRVAARRLINAGAMKGSRVGLLCSNRLDWLPIAFGAFRIGALLVPFSTLWKDDEIAYGLTHADVQILIMLPGFLRHDYLAIVNDLIPELRRTPPGRLYAARVPLLRRILLLGGGAEGNANGSAAGSAAGTERWDDLPARADDTFLDAVERTVSPADRATIFFTSGTTARAKGVVHRHAALTGAARSIASCLGITAADAWWGHMPLFWSGGFVVGGLASIAGGARIVLHEQVDANSALELLEAEHCTVMAGWHQAGPLLDHPDFGKRRRSLKKGTNHPLAAQFLGPDHLAIGVYGMSETATCATAARWSDPPETRTGTFGRPLEDTQLKIVDPETAQPVDAGATGEICVKGPTLMEAYYKLPPASTFDREGFFKTGDLGCLDGDGYLHFAGRLKDVIKTAGVNVAAAEVEDVLGRHAAVLSVHVIGVPHQARGENIAAFVVLRPGMAAGSDELRAFCKRGLASYKVPRDIFLMGDTEVPRTGSGKVDKAALRRAAQARMHPQPKG